MKNVFNNDNNVFSAAAATPLELPPRPSMASAIVGGLVSGLLGVAATVAVMVALVWLVVATALAVVSVPVNPAAAGIVEQAKAQYAPLASADDGVSYAGDQVVAGIVYVRDGADAGVNWALHKLGF